MSHDSFGSVGRQIVSMRALWIFFALLALARGAHAEEPGSNVDEVEPFVVRVEVLRSMADVKAVAEDPTAWGALVPAMLGPSAPHVDLDVSSPTVEEGTESIRAHGTTDGVTIDFTITLAPSTRGTIVELHLLYVRDATVDPESAYQQAGTFARSFVGNLSAKLEPSPVRPSPVPPPAPQRVKAPRKPDDPDRFHGKRLSISLLGGMSFAPASTDYASFALDTHYWFNELVAIGVTGALYPFVPDPGHWPNTEALWSASVTMEFAPLHATRRIPLDLYFLGGPGAIATRPVSLVDPAVRKFDYAGKIDVLLAVGVRWFVAPWLALDLRVADRVYPEKYESATIAPGTVGIPADPYSPSNPNTWLEDGAHVVNRLDVSIGFGFFVPPLRR